MKNRPRPTVFALAVALAISGAFTAAGSALAAEPSAELASGPATERWTGVSPSQRNPRGWQGAVSQEALDIAAMGSGDCTGWRSTILPPPTIRVYRQAYGPLEGTVQVVSLREWSEQVLRTQMPAYYPAETLKANALFVKQYGWYYTIHWRGGFAPDGDCYDVRDATDGFFRPEVYTPAPQQIAAVAASWPYTLRKYSYSRGTSWFFLTGYRSGAFVQCGTDSDGFHLFQHSAHDCGKDGHTWEGIMRNYVEPKLEVVDPGVHSLVSGVRGDAGVLDGSVAGQLKARTYESTGTRFLPGSQSTASIATRTLRQQVTADVSGDRLDDIVALVDTKVGRRLRVWRANGAGYAAAVSWWTDTAGITNASTQVVADDFDGDAKADIGLLIGPAVAGGNTRFMVLTSRGTSFAAPVAWWTGKLNVARIVARAGDADGDGRGDLILERETRSGNLHFLVARSRLKGGALSAPVNWLGLNDVTQATTKTIIADFNRDGRDDIVAAYATGTGMTLSALRSTGSTFTRRILWRSSSLKLSKVKLGTGDYNLDGRGDVLLLVDRDVDGSRLMVFLPNDTTGTMKTWYDDTTLDWDTARAY
jgi:hypothetical protein